MTVRHALIAIGFSVLGAGAPGAQHSQMPAGMTHEEHLRQMQKDAELRKRGVEAMGFDQDKTTHHFRLTPSGGAIEVNANQADDSASAGQIRSHLKTIAGEFSNGSFEKPLATHREVPPGVAVMKRLTSAIRYAFEETPAGGLVRIRTTDPEALRAVHDFLRYQITEHATGDPLSVQK
jgi:hypothetical protein